MVAAPIAALAAPCHLPGRFAKPLRDLPAAYATEDRVRPCHLSGDFDGDGKEDIAVVVRQAATAKRGIAIWQSHSHTWQVVGAGHAVGEGGDDFSWMDAWSVYPKGKRVEEGVEAGPPPRLRGDGLLVEKTEAASAIIYWSGKNYRWYQQGD
jgi:hypothetical protein